jgi:aspartate carbamoyltransferase regulatory subunit
MSTEGQITADSELEVLKLIPPRNTIALHIFEKKSGMAEHTNDNRLGCPYSKCVSVWV